MQRLGLSYTPKSQSRIRELFWPDVDNEVAIRTVCHTGMWVSFVVAGLTTLFIVLRVIPAASFLDVGIFVIIGFGIRKCSRIASASGVLLYIGSQIASGTFSVVALIFAFLFISSARAAFAFHRFRKQKQQMLREPSSAASS